MKAKALRQRTETANASGASLYERVQAQKPQFADSAQALEHYSRKLEEFAAQRKVTVETMLIAIEDSSSWSTEDREVFRVSEIVAALSSK